MNDLMWTQVLELNSSLQTVFKRIQMITKFLKDTLARTMDFFEYYDCLELHRNISYQFSCYDDCVSSLFKLASEKESDLRAYSRIESFYRRIRTGFKCLGDDIGKILD